MNTVPTNFLLEDGLSDDDFDALFSQLEQFEAPESMISTIMDAVSQLPLPTQKSTLFLEDYLPMITNTDLVHCS